MYNIIFKYYVTYNIFKYTQLIISVRYQVTGYRHFPVISYGSSLRLMKLIFTVNNIQTTSFIT